jgi:malonyl-CoA O-methyltransferase
MQKEMAENLIAFISQSGGFGKIMELGCGTGNLSRLLLQRFPGGNVVLSDISSEMLEQCKKVMAIGEFHGVVSWEIADAEQPMPYRDFSILCSNAMVQWFPDLKSHLQYVNDCLLPHGIYLFSGFSDSNFPELHQIIKLPPFNVSSFPGHGKSAVLSAMDETGFAVEQFKEETKRIYYSSLDGFLKILKQGGATGRPAFTMTRGKLNYLREKYTRLYGIGSNVLVTWKYWMCLARKSG